MVAGTVVVSLGLPCAAGAVTADFNRDGYSDLAIQVLGGNGLTDGGAVSVLYGGRNGLSGRGDQLWSQASPGIPGDPHVTDVWEGENAWFGSALASGDFDGDRFADLAIGVAGENLTEPTGDQGVVHVLYGAPQGLGSAGNQLWDQALAHTGVPEVDDVFGAALAAGDFDADGMDDLAIGVPGEDGGEGAVSILPGRRNGLTFHGAVGLGGAAVPEPAHVDLTRLGAALAAGNFGNGKFDDLAVGAPRSSAGPDDEVGGFAVFYGTDAGLSASGSEFNTWGDAIGGGSFPYDFHGSALAAADFGKSKQDDLVVGVPGHDTTENNAGGYFVSYGSTTGLDFQPINLLTNSFCDGSVDTGDGAVGSTLATGDLGKGSHDDFVVGAPGENVNGITKMGAACAYFGGDDGIELTKTVWIYTSLAAAFDNFASALSIGHFEAIRNDQLAVGLPGADLGFSLPDGDRGSVVVLIHRQGAFESSVSRLFSRDTPGIRGESGPQEFFGSALSP